MNEPGSGNSFVFNPLISADIILNLYENDYQYIEEIFNTALTHFQGDVEQVRSAYATKDTEALRKAVHKIKPTFGFLGMPDLEQQCRQLEEKSKAGVGIETLSGDVETLLISIQKAHEALEEDYKKLIIYNKDQA